MEETSKGININFNYTIHFSYIHTPSAQCGGEFSIFMNENGIIMSCGRGDRGTLGHGNTRL